MKKSINIRLGDEYVDLVARAQAAGLTPTEFARALVLSALADAPPPAPQGASAIDLQPILDRLDRIDARSRKHSEALVAIESGMVERERGAVEQRKNITAGISRLLRSGPGPARGAK